MFVNENNDFVLFFQMIFRFIREGRIHSSVDHFSNYSSVYDIIYNSEVDSFVYNLRFDSYSFFLKNKSNTLVDIVLIFPFGENKSNQIMITLNNQKIYFEIALSGVEKHIPIFKYATKKKIEKSWKSFFQPKYPKRPDKSEMTFDEFEVFLNLHRTHGDNKLVFD